MQVTRTLPDVQPEQSGLFGHSRGGGAALYYLLEKGNVQAVVLNSGGYPPQLAEVVSQVKAPILMLHGTADGPEDGGSAVTNIKMAREFEAKLRDAGKPVETAYYEGLAVTMKFLLILHNIEMKCSGYWDFSRDISINTLMFC